MSNTICISKAQWDQTRELLERRRVEINALVDIGIEQNETIYARDKQLASQRRTIATLRARLRSRGGGYWSRGKQQEEWLTGWRNRYDAFKYGYANLTFNGYSLREAKDRHRKRIKAIRTFGALP